MSTLVMDTLKKRDTTKFDDWPLELGPHLTSAEAQSMQIVIRSYRSCFAFSLHGLEGYKGKSIWIQLEDDHSIFRRPYTFKGWCPSSL
jgi:hypothetical protein